MATHVDIALDGIEDLMPTRKSTLQPQQLQQQQMQQQPSADPTSVVEVQLCIPEDLRRYVPRRVRAPALLPANAPLPRVGERLNLNPQSPWEVVMVAHQWLAPTHVRVEVWLEPVIGHRGERPPGFALTQ